MGADQTSGHAIWQETLDLAGSIDLPPLASMAELSQKLQAVTAFIDATGHCLFIAFAILDTLNGFQAVLDEVNGVMGTTYTLDDVPLLGGDTLLKERVFNAAAGITRSDDRLPDFMKAEPLPPHNSVFDVPDDTIDAVYAQL